LADLIKIPLDQLLLLDKLDIGQGFRGQINSLDGTKSMFDSLEADDHTHLIEAIFTAVADIDDFDDLGGKARIEHVTLTELGLEVRAAGEDQAGDVDLVVGDEVLNGEFSDLSYVVVTLLVTQT